MTSFYNPSPTVHPLLAIVLCSVFLSACTPNLPSAQLGPFQNLAVTIEIDDSASFVTDIIPAIFLICQTKERKLLYPASRSNEAKISSQTHTTHEPSKIQLAISIDQTYSATTPEPHKFNDRKTCHASARFYVYYQGATDSKAIIPATPDLLAKSWFTTDFAEVHTQKANTDLTPDFTNALQETYRIHCAHFGTAAGKPVDTLFLQQKTPDGWGTKSQLITHLNRPCTTN